MKQYQHTGKRCKAQYRDLPHKLNKTHLLWAGVAMLLQQQLSYADSLSTIENNNNHAAREQFSHELQNIMTQNERDILLVEALKLYDEVTTLDDQDDTLHTSVTNESLSDNEELADLENTDHHKSVTYTSDNLMQGYQLQDDTPHFQQPPPTNQVNTHIAHQIEALPSTPSFDYLTLGVVTGLAGAGTGSYFLFKPTDSDSPNTMEIEGEGSLIKSGTLWYVNKNGDTVKVQTDIDDKGAFSLTDSQVMEIAYESEQPILFILTDVHIQLSDGSYDKAHSPNKVLQINKFDFQDIAFSEMTKLYISDASTMDFLLSGNNQFFSSDFDPQQDPGADLNDYIKSALSVAALINSGVWPKEFTIQNLKKLQSDLKNTDFNRNSDDWSIAVKKILSNAKPESTKSDAIQTAAIKLEEHYNNNSKTDYTHFVIDAVHLAQQEAVHTPQGFTYTLQNLAAVDMSDNENGIPKQLQGPDAEIPWNTIVSSDYADSIVPGTPTQDLIFDNQLDYRNNDDTTPPPITHYTILGSPEDDYIDGGVSRSDTLVYAPIPSDQTSSEDSYTITGSLTLTLSEGTYALAKVDGPHGFTDHVKNVENVMGTNQADIITGDGNDNILYGAGGSDHLNGGKGDDTLYACIADANSDHYVPQVNENCIAEDQNWLYTSKGRDSFHGSTSSNSIDIISFSIDDSTSSSSMSSWDKPTEGVNINLHTSTISNDGFGEADKNVSDIEHIQGSEFADTLVGDTNANTFYATKGGDSIDGYGETSNTLSFEFASGAVTADLSSPTIEDNGFGASDTIAHIQNLTGSAQDDKLTGDSSVNTLTGGKGKDTLSGKASNDILDGGPGDDTLDGGPGNNTLTGGDGNDTFTLNSADMVDPSDTTVYHVNTITDFQSQLTSSDGNGDTINLVNNGGLVNFSVDNIFLLDSFSEATLKNATQIYYSDSNEFYKLLQSEKPFDITDISIDGKAIDEANFSGIVSTPSTGVTQSLSNRPTFTDLTGTQYNDTLTGNALDNNIEGLAGDDKIYGLTGKDTIDGGAGNDDIDGGAGADVIDGGEGEDTLIFNNAVTGVNVSLSKNTVSNDGFGDADASIKNIENITGTEYEDTLQGDSKVNTLDGGDSTDTVSYDYISGADGVNVDLSIPITTALHNAYVGLAPTTSTVWTVPTSATDRDQLTNIEHIIGSSNNDHITGDSKPNHLMGEGGDDFLIGNEGDDYLDGGAGVDILQGGAGDDSLDGGDGADELQGGDSDDILHGGADDDILMGGTGDDTIDGGANTAAVTGDILYGGTGRDTFVVYSKAFGPNTKAQYHIKDFYYGSSNNNNDKLSLINDGEPLFTTDSISVGYNPHNITAVYYHEDGSSDAPKTMITVNAHSGLTLSQIKIDGVQLAVTASGTVNLNTIQSGSTETDINSATRNLIADADANGVTFTGNDYNNILIGGESEDTLTGKAGDDTLDGSGGTGDTLSGGVGKDTFVVKVAEHTVTGQFVTITDFTKADDTIQLISDSTQLTPGDLLLSSDPETHDAITLTGAKSLWYKSHESGSTPIQLLKLTGEDPTGETELSFDLENILIDNVAISEANFQAANAGVSIQLAEGYKLSPFIGSEYNDHLTGNDQDTVIDGRKGSDTLQAGSGKEKFVIRSNDILESSPTTESNSNSTTKNKTQETTPTFYTDTINGFHSGNDTIELSNIWGDSSSDNPYPFSCKYGVNKGDIYLTESIAGSDNTMVTSDASALRYVYSTTGGSLEDNSTIIAEVPSTFKLSDLTCDGQPIVQMDLNSGKFGINFKLGPGDTTNPLIGTKYQDTLIGNELAQTIKGLKGDDTIEGGGGADILYGGPEVSTTDNNNTLSFASATNSVEATLGEVVNNQNQVTISKSGYEGDNIKAAYNFSKLTGGSGDDTFAGNKQSNTFDGGKGSDTIDYSNVDDNTVTITANLTFAQDNVTFFASFQEDPDTLKNIENYTGGKAIDNVTDSIEDNTIKTGGSDDTITLGNGGDDTVDGGRGKDTLSFDTTNPVTVDLSKGTASFDSNTIKVSNIENVTGDSGNDSITDNSENNVIMGDTGDDTIYVGHGGTDIVYGGTKDGTSSTNNNTLDFSAASDAVTITFPGTGTAQGTATIGSDATDTVTLYDFKTLVGSKQDDTFNNENPATQTSGTTYDGGSGKDTVIFAPPSDQSNNTITVALPETGESSDATYSSDAPTSPISYKLKNIENYTTKGTAKTETVTDSSEDNVITTGDGDSTINLWYGGKDTIDAGRGTNTLNFSKASSAITVDLSKATGTVGSDALTIKNATNITIIVGATDQVNTITASDTSTTITGGHKKDVITGGAENDDLSKSSTGGGTLKGEAGNDTLTATTGTNDANNPLKMYGGKGGDTLNLKQGSNAEIHYDKADYFSGNDITSAGTWYTDTLTCYHDTNKIYLSTPDGSTRSDFQSKLTFDTTTLTYQKSSSSTQHPLIKTEVDSSPEPCTLADLTSSSIFIDGKVFEPSVLTASKDATGDSFTGNSADNTMIVDVLDKLTIDGKEGTNTVDYSDRPNSITATLPEAGSTSSATRGEVKDALSNIQNITGTSEADNITDSSLANTILAGAGNDTITAGKGGVDHYDGGDGIDTLDVSNSTSDVTISLDSTTTGSISGSSVTLKSIETITPPDHYAINLTSTQQRLTIEVTNHADNTFTIGSFADNITITGNGSNTIKATGGKNTINTGTGDDTITTGSGVDTITDNGGSNTISLGSGNDNVTLTGTSGSTQTIKTEGGHDNIILQTNISSGSINGGNGTDKLDFSGIPYSSNLSIQSGNSATLTSNGNTCTLTNIEEYVGKTGTTVDFSDATSALLLNINEPTSTYTSEATAQIGKDTSTSKIINLYDFTTFKGTSNQANTFTMSDGISQDFTFEGNGNNNTVDYSALMHGILAILSSTTQTIGTDTFTAQTVTRGTAGNEKTDTVLNIQNITADNGSDNSIIDSSDGNVITTGSGNDTIYLWHGGKDTIDAGSGNNTLDFTQASSAITVDLKEGTGTVGSDAITVTNINYIVGTNSNSSITAHPKLANYLTGDGHDNTFQIDNSTGKLSYLVGNGGSDTFMVSSKGNVHVNIGIDVNDTSGDTLTCSTDYGNKDGQTKIYLYNSTETGTDWHENVHVPKDSSDDNKYLQIKYGDRLLISQDNQGNGCDNFNKNYVYCHKTATSSYDDDWEVCNPPSETVVHATTVG